MASQEPQISQGVNPGEDDVLAGVRGSDDSTAGEFVQRFEVASVICCLTCSQHNKEKLHQVVQGLQRNVPAVARPKPILKSHSSHV